MSAAVVETAYCLLCFREWPCEQHPDYEGPVWCGFCRKGAHGDCRGLRGAVKAEKYQRMNREEFCSCSCDPTQPFVPGQRYAREWEGYDQAV